MKIHKARFNCFAYIIEFLSGESIERVLFPSPFIDIPFGDELNIVKRSFSVLHSDVDICSIRRFYF